MILSGRPSPNDPAKEENNRFVLQVFRVVDRTIAVKRNTLIRDASLPTNKTMQATPSSNFPAF